MHPFTRTPHSKPGETSKRLVNYDEVGDVLRHSHKPSGLGHLGRDATMIDVHEKFHLLVNVREAVELFLYNCIVCAVLRPKQQHVPSKTIIPRKPGHIVSVVVLIENLTHELIINVPLPGANRLHTHECHL